MNIPLASSLLATGVLAKTSPPRAMNNCPEQSSDKYQDIAELVAMTKPDEPVLCFNSMALVQRAQLFLQKFPGKTAFAVKANPEPCVISTLHNAGIGFFDVASPGEMALVHGYAPGAAMHYHNPIKSRQEIATAFHHYNCRRFAIDDVEELHKIADICGGGNGVEIAVRLRLPAMASSVHDFSTKFGAPPDRVILMLQECVRLGFQPLITFHPGSQCYDVQGWVRHIRVAAQLAREAGVLIAKLNIGGGFPQAYRDMTVPQLQEIFAVIEAAISENFDDQEPQLECEPGRALVASCMTLVARVKSVRRDAREVFINDGIYGTLMEASQAPALMPAHKLLGAPNKPSTKILPFTVYGPTCDPLDCLPLPLSLPCNIEEGDYIAFENVGAYGNATATRFNGYGSVQIVEMCSR